MDHFHPFFMAMLNNQRVLATGGRFSEISFEPLTFWGYPFFRQTSMENRAVMVANFLGGK